MGYYKDELFGPLTFNIFVNDVVFFVSKSDIGIFFHDNTISASGKTQVWFKVCSEMVQGKLLKTNS